MVRNGEEGEKMEQLKGQNAWQQLQLKVKSRLNKI